MSGMTIPHQSGTFLPSPFSLLPSPFFRLPSPGSKPMPQSLADALNSGYGFTDASIVFGAALDGTSLITEPKVRVPLAMTNRHGLIAGATGTGKTKTLQLLTEQFSAAGVPVFVADIKGDLSGIAVPGEESDRVKQRIADTGFAWKAGGCPVEFLSLTGKGGAQLRAT